MKNESEKLYRANDNFMLREIAGENILIPVGEAAALNNSVIELNETSCFLWKQFREPSTIKDVIENAKKIYSDTTGSMEQEIKSFVEEYCKVGLLKEEI